MTKKKLTITIHPNPLSGEYLSVKDAFCQITDLISTLEISESKEPENRQIVWRLTEAYTNSPPFTIVSVPYPVSDDQSVDNETDRVVGVFVSGLRSLLAGEPSKHMIEDALEPMVRLLQRNLNGVSTTDIRFADDNIISIQPQSARLAKRTIELAVLEAEASKPDLQRTEFGTATGEIVGISRWYRKPAMIINERLSEERFICVLGDELSKKIGPLHHWREVWEGRQVNVSGALHFDTNGTLKRADIYHLEEINWSDVSLADLRDIDVLRGSRVAEHIKKIRDELDG